MSLRKALSPILFIAASLSGLSSAASASMFYFSVETNDYDLIGVDGFFVLDTTDGGAVTDWDLNVTLQEDPGFTMANSWTTADVSAAGSMISFIANNPMDMCDSNGDCISQLDIVLQPIGAITGPTVIGVDSVCAWVTSTTVTFAPNTRQVCNSMTSSVMFTASPAGGVAAVPEPTALALFGIGMLVIYPIQRRLYR
jgi:hypothetical protein